MRRDDAKKLISALIRRRHNDALRIKKLKSRLNDADQYKASQEIESINKDLEKMRNKTKNNVLDLENSEFLDVISSIQGDLDDASAALYQSKPERAKNFILGAMKDIQKQSGMFLRWKQQLLDKVKNPTSNNQKKNKEAYIKMSKACDELSRDFSGIAQRIRKVVGMFGNNS